ncbi:hypothetical protein [Bacillus rhizoplanae]|uniref:hypothetical protein n=1 Tax=Bacillus rhizoplanae TaxID=2880966 RepID=UPI003D23F6AC
MKQLTNTLAIRSDAKGHFFKNKIPVKRMMNKSFYVQAIGGEYFYVQGVRDIHVPHKNVYS